jgi:large subunit ribosomal protein L32e
MFMGASCLFLFSFFFSGKRCSVLTFPLPLVASCCDAPAKFRMVTPLKKPTVVKKRLKQFVRHQSDLFLRIGEKKWRKPKGIDSRVRRRYKGNMPMVRIGYGTNAKHRHLLPNGFLKFRVNNVKDLELLLMHNRKYAAEIAHNVSVRKRQQIVERALQLNVKVINGNAKLRTQEVLLAFA